MNKIMDFCMRMSGMSEDEIRGTDHRTYGIKGLDEICSLVTSARDTGRRVAICGDYDADGIMASAIMGLAMIRYGIRANRIRIRLPHRFSEGYGLSEKAVTEIEDGSLLITVDNGIAAPAAVRLAKQKGMTVVVTDHHLPLVDGHGRAVYPDADVIIDPNAVPDSADFCGYCGAGLAYKFSERLLGESVPEFAACAAIATIADSVPVTGDNRRILKAGLSALSMGQAPAGVVALMKAMRISTPVTTDDIAFRIAPALNAPGRLDDKGAAFSLSLIFANASGLAERKAERVRAFNEERKAFSETWTRRFIEQIEKAEHSDDYPIVEYCAGVPEGLIGLIAGRIAERYAAPCILLTDAAVPGIIKGSGRSDGRINLKELLDAAEAHLLTHGGHAAAAGLSLTNTEFDAFRAACLDACAGKRPQRQETVVEADIVVTPKEIPEALATLELCAPFGEGNPAPLFEIRDVRLGNAFGDTFSYIGSGRGVKLMTRSFDVVDFDGADAYKAAGEPTTVNVIGKLSINRYNGRERAQVEATEIRAGG